MVERVLCEHQRVAEHAGRAEPIIIRLSGHVQYTDRLAMREIARQLVQQTGDGGAFLDPTAEDDEEPAEEDIAPIVVDEEENPFLDKWSVGSSKQPEVNVRLPPTAHLPSLVSMLPALGRPVILVLDAFDLFALHARQALLYCLLDTVQHSQAGANGAHFTTINATPGKKGKEKQELAWNGLAVVGVTTRVDTLELLEKRVKSRFSGRMIRTTGPAGWGQWERIVRGVLCPERITESGGKAEEAWRVLWEGAVETFLNGKATREALRETVALVQDVHLMTQILVSIQAASLRAAALTMDPVDGRGPRFESRESLANLFTLATGHQSPAMPNPFCYSVQ